MTEKKIILKKKPTATVVSQGIRNKPRKISINLPEFNENKIIPRRKARIIIMQILYSLNFYTGDDIINYIEDMLNLKWVELKLRKKDIIFINNISRKIISHLEDIDKLIINNLKNWDMDRINIITKSILRMSIFEIKFLNETPREIVINESVEISKIFSDNEQYKFINALLDKI